MTIQIQIVKNPKKEKHEPQTAQYFDVEKIKQVRAFHESFPQYRITSLQKLDYLAKSLGIKAIYMKDESSRFGLGSFKVLGGSYAIGMNLAKKLNKTIDQITFDYLKQPEVRKRLGEITFATATDGNHGRGVAWTAKQLQYASKVFLPKGSSEYRLKHIKEAGAEAVITSFNYDETVRFVAEKAAENGWEVIQDTSWEGYVDTPIHIMQGYTTMADEIVEQLEDIEPTHIFIQAGVGAFAGAIVAYLTQAFRKKPIIVVVEPEKADCLFQTCKQNDNQLHYVTGDLDTIMAGLACGEPNPLGWEILSQYADYFISLSDEFAAKGMRVLGNPLENDPRIVSGESGAVSIGLVTELLSSKKWSNIRNELELNEHSVILTFNTEGDTDPEMYRKIVWDGLYPFEIEN